MKKKIAILINTMGVGGAERVVSNLLNVFAEDYELTLVLLDNIIGFKIPPNVKVHCIKGMNKNGYGLLKLIQLPILAYRYYRFCKKKAVEVSFSFLSRPNFINVISGFFGNKSRIIINERSFPRNVYPGKLLKDLVPKFLIKKLYPKADLILTNSNATQLSLKSDFGINGNSRVIFNPIDIGKVITQSVETVEFDFSRFTFITMGRLGPEKNHKLLIEAFAEVSDKDTQLLILGEGNLKEDLKKQIMDLKMQGRIFLIGLQSNPYKFLSKSNCFVFSSNYEGFPNAILEAMVCRLPIISTDCLSGPREILAPSSDYKFEPERENEYGEFGILVPVDKKQRLTEAMNTIITDTALRHSYALKSYCRGFDFRLEKIATQYKMMILEAKIKRVSI